MSHAARSQRDFEAASRVDAGGEWWSPAAGRRLMGDPNSDGERASLHDQTAREDPQFRRPAVRHPLHSGINT